MQGEISQVVSTIVYFFVGFGLFGLGIWLMESVTPFSIRKEIEEDQNIALAIIMASGILGLALVLSAAIR